MAATTSTDLLSVQLSVNGKISGAGITEISVTKAINKIAKARLVLQDGSKAKEDFKLSDSSDYVPGNTIEIKAGYHSKEKTIFKGIIVNQAIQISPEEGPSLIIDCKDEAIAATMARKNAYFLKSKDSDIIKKILGNYKFSKKIAETKVKYEEVVQFGATDWDFIISRAEINGLVVYTDDGEFMVQKPAVASKPVATCTYGDDIIELNLAVGSADQFAAVNAVAWDASNQKMIKGKSKEPKVNEAGSINGKKLANVLDAQELLQSPVPIEKPALDAWASAQLLKSRLSRFQGTITCEGNAAIKPNSLIQIKGVGKKINGKAFVSAVFHDLVEGRWTTEITIGLQRNWFAQEIPINALKAGGRLPAMNGLHIGVVKKTHQDPEGAFRVQVTLPLIQDSDDGIWARLSTFYASKGFGNFFYPEIGDEVILGFLDDNPSAPIILGSVYSKTNAPALVPDDKNNHKAIVTRTKMILNFDEEKKIITLETPAKNIITISDEDKGIRLEDQHKNMIQMDASGILIDSSKDITIKAANNIEVSGVNIKMKASANLDIAGNNTTAKAQMAFLAQGGATADLKASGNITIKGAMVAVN